MSALPAPRACLVGGGGNNLPRSHLHMAQGRHYTNHCYARRVLIHKDIKRERRHVLNQLACIPCSTVFKLGEKVVDVIYRLWWCLILVGELRHTMSLANLIN